MTHQMPLLHSGTQRNYKDFSSDVPSNAVLVWHQMQTFLENYGCGCVWAVPDFSQHLANFEPDSCEILHVSSDVLILHVVTSFVT